jgi:hypothetical protein
MADADVTINQGDAFTIDATLKDALGVVVSLVAAQGVKFEMKHISNADAFLEKDATIRTASAGTVRFSGVAADSAVHGAYEGRFQVLWNDGTKTHFPNGAPLDILITEELVSG